MNWVEIYPNQIFDLFGAAKETIQLVDGRLINCPKIKMNSYEQMIAGYEDTYRMKENMYKKMAGFASQSVVIIGLDIEQKNTNREDQLMGNRKGNSRKWSSKICFVELTVGNYQN